MGYSPHIQIEANIRWFFSAHGPALKNSIPDRLRQAYANMKQNLLPLSQQYVTALERHLKQGPHASLSPALNLQDEIARTLLGINVRLLCLKQEARSKTNGLKSTITNSQRLVANSARSVRQAGREMGGL
jgi:hypothetical protein